MSSEHHNPRQMRALRNRWLDATALDEFGDADEFVGYRETLHHWRDDERDARRRNRRRERRMAMKRRYAGLDD